MTSSAIAAPFPGFVLGSPQASGGITIGNVDLSIVNDVDEESLALRIGRTILEAAKRRAENSV